MLNFNIKMKNNFNYNNNNNNNNITNNNNNNNSNNYYNNIKILQNKINQNKYIQSNIYLKPFLPLHKNIFPLIDKKINIEPFKQEIFSYNKSWNNKDSYSNSWKSITIKSKNGLDQDFLENIDFKNYNFKYTEVSNFFPSIVNFLNTLKVDVYLVRLLKLNKYSIIKYHTDEVVFKNIDNIIRCHLPIITDNNVLFKIGLPLLPPSKNYSIWNAETIYEKYLNPGFIWYTNVNCLHSVHNNSNIDRIHLVFDIKTPENFLNNLNNII